MCLLKLGMIVLCRTRWILLQRDKQQRMTLFVSFICLKIRGLSIIGPICIPYCLGLSLMLKSLGESTLNMLIRLRFWPRYSMITTFQPQNLMVEYVNSAPHSCPEKRCPYAASSTEWAYLSAFTHELEPTNRSRQNIVRGGNWIKSTWGEVQWYLHQVRILMILLFESFILTLTVFSFLL